MFIPEYRVMSNSTASSNFVSTSNITWIKSNIFDHGQSGDLLEHGQKHLTAFKIYWARSKYFLN
jgi:hypothetical protein